MLQWERNKLSSKCVYWLVGCIVMLVVVFAFRTASAEETSSYPLIDTGWAEEGNPLDLDVQSAYLLDAVTGQVMYRFEENKRIQPASLSKIMTFNIVLEEIKKGNLAMTDEVTISENAWRLALDASVSRMFVEVGEQVSVRDLLYGLMVSSGNDAAVALAEHIAGTERAFVELMNQRAAELGLKNTVFKNSHGLEADGQYTTAADMAILARHVVLEHPEGLEITKTKEFQYGIEYSQPNFNSLVFRDPRVTGLKTGHLSVSGYHLVATAEDEDGRSIIAIVMGADSDQSRANEAYALLQHGFREYTNETIDWKQTSRDTVPVFKGSSREVSITTPYPLLLTVKKGEAEKLEVQQVLNEPLVAPIDQGQVVGQLTVLLDGKQYKKTDLIAENSVARGGWWRSLVDSVRLLLRNITGS